MYAALNTRRLAVVLATVALSCGWLSRAVADTFEGWQGMRVIKQEGNPRILRSADLDQDGRDELIVVNTRHSRLDIYQWLPVEQRHSTPFASDDRPNDLPMAPEMERQEVQLERLPHDVVVADVDHDNQPELVILMGPPHRVVIYELDDASKWQEGRSFDLLPAKLTKHAPVLLLRQVNSEVRELLISCANGIQRLTLNGPGRAQWLTPREHRSRAGWWLIDLDGDGDQDLVERQYEATESVRWYECADDGVLRPAQVLFDRAIDGAEALQVDDRAGHLMLLDASAKGLLRRFKLDRAERSLLGQRQSLPMPGGTKAVWCGIELDGKPAIVAVDRERPRLLLYMLGASGWHLLQDYPSISSVRAIAAPRAAAGTLLLWAKDAAELYRSQWENGRLTYPKPLAQSSDVQDRKIVALGAAASTTWWVQRTARDLDLYDWSPSHAKPRRTRFTGAGKIKSRGKDKEVDQVLWLSGGRIVFKQIHERAARLAVISGDEEQTIISQPPHLKDMELSQLRLLAVDDTLRVARFNDGVLQWLDENLHPVDQIMLAQGQQMADYAPLSPTRGWALQKDGQFAHLLEAEPSGLPKITTSIRLAGGLGFVQDPVVGLVLVEHHRITRLTEGEPRELALVESIDQRVGRPSGVKEAAINRISATDVTGDGRDDIILFDDRRHQLTVLTDENGKMVPTISWPVFEDKKYPYGGSKAPAVPEPRAAVAADIDGDRKPDLAMICHDRLIIYLASDQQ